MSATALALTALAVSAPPSQAETSSHPKAYGALLSPFNEVPPVTDSDAMGRAHISLNARAGRVCVDLAIDPAPSSAITAMHIHRGTAGVNGPIVIGLTDILEGEACVRGLTSAEEQEVIRDVRANPQAYYLNLHTEEHPAGELRGQVIPVRHYEVTVVNLTDGQPNSPVVAGTHTTPGAFWEAGEPASPGLQAIAENGLPSTAVAELTGDPTFFDVAAAPGPSAPPGTPGAESGLPDRQTVHVSAGPGVNLLSLATMLVCSNDGFTGANSLELPDVVGGQVVHMGVGYDAGTELNTERLADIVPPCQGAIGVTDPDNPGTAMTDPALAEGDVITHHEGIMGVTPPAGQEGDVFLDPEVHDWTDPVSEVIVTRIH